MGSTKIRLRGAVGAKNQNIGRDVIQLHGSGICRAKRAERLRAVALTTFPVTAAATRFRVVQFVERLRSHDIDLTLLPFLSEEAFAGLYNRRKAFLTAMRLLLALLRRLAQVPRILRADVLLVQREAMLFGPPIIEWLAVRAGVPFVLDLDDATWITLRSPVYGWLAGLLKFRGKTDWLIRHAHSVICGNETIATYVRAAGAHALVIPAIVDADVFKPRPQQREPRNGLPVAGWIGTHGTWDYFRTILPVLETVAESVPFRLRIIGSGQDHLHLRGIEVELMSWRGDREVQDFQMLDVGLYPLPDDIWAGAKSGLKAVEYLACGVPYVASPVGVVAEIGEPGVTHYLAATPEEWRVTLEHLLRDEDARVRMSAAGRRHMVEHYDIDEVACTLAGALRLAASRAKP